MSNPTTPKELFSVWGTIQLNEGKKKFAVKAPHYYQDRINRLHEGDIVLATFSKKIPTRSESQLRYHMVLMGYIGEYAGLSTQEAHDAIMRLKFGVKRVFIGNRAIEVRKSLSNGARMGKADVVDLIDYDLKLCEELGIKVPTAQELGYLPH